MKHKPLFVLVTMLFIQYSTQALDNKCCDVNWNFQCGDALGISAIPDTGFPNGIYQINKNGFVDLPMLGPVKVTQTKRDSFEMFIRSAYVSYVNDPNIQIRRLIRVSILGGFIKPGLYWISTETSLWNAVYIAGGTTSEDGVKKMRWERNGKTVKKSLIEDFQSGKTLDEMGFSSGDQISVNSRSKKSTWEFVLQDVIPILSFAITIVTFSIGR
jgi:protein involved in polysaccharide export with SLBB domain